MTRRSSGNVTAHLVLLRALLKPKSKKQLEEITGFNHETIQRWITELHRNWPNNLIHIAFYKKDMIGRQWTAYWVWGPGQCDADKPKPITAAESCKKWRLKQATKTEKPLRPVSVANQLNLGVTHE